MVTIASDCFRFVDLDSADTSAENSKLSFAVSVQGNKKPLLLRTVLYKVSGVVHVVSDKVDVKALTGEVQSNFEGTKAVAFTAAGDSKFSYSYFGKIDEVLKFTFKYKVPLIVTAPSALLFTDCSFRITSSPPPTFRRRLLARAIVSLPSLRALPRRPSTLCVSSIDVADVA